MAVSAEQEQKSRRRHGVAAGRKEMAKRRQAVLAAKTSPLAHKHARHAATLSHAHNRACAASSVRRGFPRLPVPLRRRDTRRRRTQEGRCFERGGGGVGGRLCVVCGITHSLERCRRTARAHSQPASQQHALPASSRGQPQSSDRQAGARWRPARGPSTPCKRESPRARARARARHERKRARL